VRDYSENEIDGFILTGGRSSRMGEDKSNLRIGDSTILKMIAKALAPATREVFTVGGLGGGGFTHFADLPENDSNGKPRPKSSMAGLLSALHHADSKWIFVVACDMPFVTTGLFEVIASKRADDFGAVVPVNAEGVPQPMCALYNVAVCIGECDVAVRAGELSNQKLLKRVNALELPYDELRGLAGSELFFTNVNTPDEYLAARSISERM
jgi:molybdopterin-guanine dinucleotide biosynthesis protein A